MFQKKGDGPNPLDHVCQEFPVVGREGSDFASVGPNTRGGDGVAEKIGVGGTDLRLGRRELEVVFPQLLQQFRNGEDVSGRMEDDDFVDCLNEPYRRRAIPLWHDQPLEEAWGCAKCRERDRVFVGRFLVE